MNWTAFALGFLVAPVGSVIGWTAAWLIHKLVVSPLLRLWRKP